MLCFALSFCWVSTLRFRLSCIALVVCWQEARANESQAIGRAHRQGQTKRIVVARFIVKVSSTESWFRSLFLSQDTIEYDIFKRNTL